MWANGQTDLLQSELEKHGTLADLNLSPELDLLRSLRLTCLEFLWPVIDLSAFKETTHYVLQEMENLGATPAAAALARYSRRSGLLARIGRKMAQLLADFVEHFEHLIPIFSLRFLDSRPTNIWDDFGLTTASFEDLKEFYIDCYEVAADALALVVALNNVKCRGRFRAMAARRRDIVTLEDFISKPKGARVAFVDGSEPFDRLVRATLNGRLRNAIGHRSFSVDHKTQTIRYFPDGDETTTPQELFVGAFLEQTWRLFETLWVHLGEAIFQVRKLEYMVPKRVLG